MSGLFGNLFDFNHDGKLDSFEKAAEMAAFFSFMEEEKNQINDDYDTFEDDEDDEDDY